MSSIRIDKQVKKYIDSLDENSRKAYQIAKGMLGTSFDITKCIGFKNWREKNNK